MDSLNKILHTVCYWKVSQKRKRKKTGTVGSDDSDDRKRVNSERMKQVRAQRNADP